mmetsp:Transcript_19433/g.61917  ORF Transcript_19433/g.61917 Transcript_19433/m.61917 type:complete len:238 (-) Transcript_19433:1115-1828(-)
MAARGKAARGCARSRRAGGVEEAAVRPARPAAQRPCGQRRTRRRHCTGLSTQRSSSRSSNSSRRRCGGCPGRCRSRLALTRSASGGGRHGCLRSGSTSGTACPARLRRSCPRRQRTATETSASSPSGATRTAAWRLASPSAQCASASTSWAAQTACRPSRPRCLPPHGGRRRSSRSRRCRRTIRSRTKASGARCSRASPLRTPTAVLRSCSSASRSKPLVCPRSRSPPSSHGCVTRS